MRPFRRPKPRAVAPPSPAELDAWAEQTASRYLGGYLALLIVAWVAIVFGIWWFGWETMEPLTYVIAGTLALGGYVYFAITLQELSPVAFRRRLVEQERRKLYQANGLPWPPAPFDDTPEPKLASPPQTGAEEVDGRISPSLSRPLSGEGGGRGVGEGQPSGQRPFLAALRDEMVARFDEADLRGLAFDLGLDDEELEGNTKSGKAQSLVEEAARQGMVKSLLERCRALRPNAGWPSPPSPGSDGGDQRALERAYLKHRLSREVEEEFTRPEEIVTQAGRGEVRAVPMAVTYRCERPEFAALEEMARAAVPREPRDWPDIRQAIAEVPRAVLLGEPGAGKTTTLRALERAAIERAQADEAAPIPLFVPLNRWPPGEPLERFVAAGLGPLGARLAALLRDGRATLLLDALNEAPGRVAEVRGFVRANPTLGAVVSCREQDLPDDLGLERLTIQRLSQASIRDYARRALGDNAGETFFWQLAGGDDVRKVWEKWCGLGATWEQFWTVADMQRDVPQVYAKTTGDEDKTWREKVRDAPRSLLRLAETPYMLRMLRGIYEVMRVVPANRGQLFEWFVAALLQREGLATLDTAMGQTTISAAGQTLLRALARLAFHMQERANRDGAGGTLTTLPRREVVPAFLDETQWKQGVDTNILLLGDPVRFSHQLLQEWFAASHLRAEMARLPAATLWPRERWWERTGWEETAVLLAGLHADDPAPVLRWLQDANPEVGAECLARSGAQRPDERTLDALRDRWLARLTDLRRDPDPRARAAVGRALAVADLDRRRGVGLRDGLPDIDWVPIPGGPCRIGGDLEAYQSLPAEEVTLKPFWMARYPITFGQFQAFVDARDGYGNAEWWDGLEHHPAPRPQRFRFANHPRDNVDWYEAVAFCRWLSSKLNHEVRLPTEREWERAARGPDGWFFPWGNEWDAAKANTAEGRVGQTTAVGIYPQGASREGLLDISGNVWEWTSDQWGKSRQKETSARVRGGSWYDGGHGARGASRDGWPLDYWNDLFGFRVASSSAPAVL